MTWSSGMHSFITAASRLLVLVALAAPLSSSLQAQVSRAAIKGTVTDQSGAVIVGAELELENVNTGVSRNSVTNAQGNYSFLNLEPGTYTLRATMEGFRTSTVSPFQLVVNQTATFDIVMQVGSVAESVTVEALGAEIQSQTAELGTVIGQQEVLDLPLNGRNFTQLITLTPGASPVSVAQNSSGFGANPVGSFSFPSINGQLNRSNIYTLDGINNIGSHVNTYAVAPVVDAIQEFKVQSHNDQAEFGGALGGVVNVVTKSGTNEFHGSVWEFLRNDALDARNPFFSDVTSLRQNQFGATGGGPIVRNKTFFFGSYQGFRRRQASETLARVPTDANLRGDLSNLQTRLFNPFTTREDPASPGSFTRDAFVNNQIPQSLLDPGMVAFARDRFPAPENTGVEGSNHRDATPVQDDLDEWSIRADHQFGSNKSLMFRFSESRHPVTFSGGYEGLLRTEDLDAKNFGWSYVHTLNPTSVMEIQVGRTVSDFERLVQFEGMPPREQPAGLLSEVGFTPNFACGFQDLDGVEQCFLPGVNIPGFVSGSTQRTAIRFSDTWQWKGSFTKIIGNHTLKMGADFNSLGNSSGGPRQNASVGFAAQQTANPQISGTGNALGSFLLGVPDSAGRRNSFETLHGGWVNGFYFQDQWKVTSRLNFNWGLRWDVTLIPVYGSPEDNNDEVGDLDLIRGIYVLKRPVPSCEERGQAPCIPGGLERQRDVVVDPRNKIYHNVFDNWQPRLGLAYRLTDRTALRVSYGIYFDNWAGFSQIAQNFEGSWPSVEQLLEQNLNQPSAGQPAPSRTAQDPFDLGTGAVFPAPTPFNQVLWFADPFYENAYSQQWNFGLQHQLTQNTVLEANYVGSSSTRLNLGGFFNTAREPGPGDPRERSPFPHIRPSFFDRSWGRSNYNAFQFRLDRTFSDGLAYLVSYTWSKSIDIGCSGFFGVEGCGIQDPFNFNNDRSVSGFDLTQVLSTSWIYEFPVGSGGKFQSGNVVLDQLIGNWQLNGILQMTSGVPYHVGVSGDIANTGNAGIGFGSGYMRLNLAGDPELNNPTPARWFDQDAFTVPAPFTFGNLGRHSLRGDGLVNLDLSLFRRFPVAEDKSFEFRFEVFNGTNTPTWGLPVTNFNNTNFGRIFSTRSTERQMQFGLKFLF